MNEEEQFEQIEKYLNQELSVADQQAFEQQIKADATLAREVELHREMISFLSDTKGIELDLKLSEIGETYVKERSNTKVETNTPKLTVQRSRWWAWGGAASFLVLLTVGWWFTRATINTEELFAESYQTYISDEFERSDNGASATPLKLGIKAYVEEDYVVAIEQLQLAFREPNSPNNNHETIGFHLAMSTIEMGNYKAAKEYLEQVVNSQQKTKMYTQQAYWYLALIQLKEGKPKVAKTSLEKLLEISDKGKYGQQAQKLLKKL